MPRSAAIPCSSSNAIESISAKIPLRTDLDRIRATIPGLNRRPRLGTLALPKLKLPGDYSDDPTQALTMFCGRFLEILLYEGSILMCRVSIAEATRFPEGAAQYYDVIFTTVNERLSAYLKKTFGLSAKGSAEASPASPTVQPSKD